MSVLAQIGNYRLEREIGRGASSEVWLGRHTYLADHVVAVKILVSQERETVRRFQREAAIAARLRHPNIAQLFDYGYIEPWHYTVLEYIEGGTLRQILERRGRLPLVEALAIFAQIAEALDYAHKLSVIHRDISPANILVEEQTGRSLLTDFGIARDAGQPITVSRLVMGTPGYLSPEHAQSATSVTHLSDIFGLGIVLYQMLSGELPWPDTSGLPSGPGFSVPLPLKERGVDGVPADVDRVLGKLLALDPGQRYPSATAAVEDLRRILQRHETPTQVLVSASPVTGRTIEFQSGGVEPNQIEAVLAPDIERAVLERAHRRAEELCDPTVVANLLDAWAGQDRLRRRPLLGRLARLHKVTSRNVYFYQLRVLYERRANPEDLEEPDRKAQVFPLEPEIERWSVTLPPAEAFADEAGGRVGLPGSTRVVVCKDCAGKGATLCARCHGKQRIYVARAASAPAQPAHAEGVVARAASAPAAAQASTSATATRIEQVLVPCPDCSGRGGLACRRCEGIGRLVLRKSFRWSRTMHLLEAQDDLPALDEHWLARACKAVPVYCERQKGGMRPEWAHLDPVTPLLKEAEAHCDGETRIALSELTISLIPVTDIVFDLGKTGDNNLYKLTIFGFEKLIPPDWRFFNWERVVYICLIAFLAVIVLVLLAFAFIP